MPHWLYVCLISMIPVVELRGAIPAGALLGVHPALCYAMAVLGNLIPVPFILLFITWFLERMKKAKWGWVNRFAFWLEAKAERGRNKMKNGAFVGLALFVAIPLPGTGAWTGSLIAALFGFKKPKAFLSILSGVLVAGLIMTLGAYGIVGIFRVFGGGAPATTAPETIPEAAACLCSLLA